MTLEAGLFQFLHGRQALRELIADGENFRAWRLQVPQGSAMPCVVFQRSATQRSQTYCGTIKAARATMQVDSYGLTMQSAERVAEAVRVALSDFAGMMGTVRVRNVVLEAEFDLDDPEPGLFRRSQSYTIWFVE